MLDDKFLKDSYYYNAISKFLLNSYGVKQRLDVQLAILKNLDDMAEEIFSRLDIFDVAHTKTYFERNRNTYQSIYADATDDKFLDLIASIYNISRTMTITYTYEDEEQVSHTKTETITLSNYELYIYIKVMISKLNFGGTYGEILDLYGRGTISSYYDVSYLGIIYIWQTGTLASQNCYVIFNNKTMIDNFYIEMTSGVKRPNTNLVKLFLADYLLLESLGIQYIKYLGRDIVTARWYDDDTNTGALFYGSPVVHVFA